MNCKDGPCWLNITHQTGPMLFINQLKTKHKPTLLLHHAQSTSLYYPWPNLTPSPTAKPYFTFSRFIQNVYHPFFDLVKPIHLLPPPHFTQNTNPSPPNLLTTKHLLKSTMSPSPRKNHEIPNLHMIPNPSRVAMPPHLSTTTFERQNWLRAVINLQANQWLWWLQEKAKRKHPRKEEIIIIFFLVY